LQDQGYTAAYMHMAARELGFDKLDNYLTTIVGVLIGYFMLGQDSVVDDLLRNVGNVLKTFPARGGETLTTSQRQILKGFVKYSTFHTKHEYSKLVGSRKGEVVCMAPSGAQDKYNPENGFIEMTAFGKGTANMLVEASNKGALVLPLFVDYESDAAIVKFLEPRAVTSEEQSHQVGRDIAKAGNKARLEYSSAYPDIGRFKVPVKYTTS
jgi:hypothetical protein